MEQIVPTITIGTRLSVQGPLVVQADPENKLMYLCAPQGGLQLHLGPGTSKGYNFGDRGSRCDFRQPPADHRGLVIAMWSICCDYKGRSWQSDSLRTEYAGVQLTNRAPAITAWGPL